MVATIQKLILLLVSISLWIIPAQAKNLVWIDTDPACGYSDSSDVDDCLALAFALNSPELEIVGISTIYGNESLEVSEQTLNKFLTFLRKNTAQKKTPPVFKGAKHDHSGSLELTPASRAIAKELKKHKLTIIALGPLTNIASVIHHFPELQPKINCIIAIAGKHPGDRFFPGENKLTMMRDFNFKKDRSSFGVVFHTNVLLILTGFEAASHAQITSKDLQQLNEGTPAAQWIAKQSQGWLKLWNDVFLNKGFYPFDSLAIGYAVNPQLLQCQKLPARIKTIDWFFLWKTNDEIEISKEFDGEREVIYCQNISSDFHKFLLHRLSSL